MHSMTNGPMDMGHHAPMNQTHGGHMSHHMPVTDPMMTGGHVGHGEKTGNMLHHSMGGVRTLRIFTAL